MNFWPVSLGDRIRQVEPITVAQVLRCHAADAAGFATTNVRGTKGAGRRS